MTDPATATPCDWPAARPQAAATRGLWGHGVARGLSLAAAPTFAIMALISAFGGGPADMLCASAHASPLSGMAAMYALMSAFHLAPWLRLIR
jgi:hypothetical protein